jgi:hypothetical protein
VLVPPSPNCQDHELTLPCEVSVKFTAIGAVPCCGVALNPATGAPVVTLIDFVAVVVPPLPVTVSVTE